MNKNNRPPHRRSIRLKGYDYSLPGLYYITLCTKNREHLFGTIENNEILLNDAGRIARDEWARSPDIRHEIDLHEFVVMPNHMHGIVGIRCDANDDCRGDRPVAPTDNPVTRTMPVARANDARPCGPAPKSIGSFIAGYKSSVTKKINVMRNTPGVPVWQRNYYEHIIRDEESCERIAEYIISNPVNWREDDYFA
jgi:putative transposase